MPLDFKCNYDEIIIFGVTIIECFELSFWFYQIFLIVITTLAVAALKRFEGYIAQVKEDANIVINKKDIIDLACGKMSYIKTRLGVPGVLAAIFVAHLFVNNTRLILPTHSPLKLYAAILSFCAAAAVILAYISLIDLIYTMRRVYQLKFDKYIFYYPITTAIFEKYNTIIASGLVRFWLVSILVMSLVFLVLQERAYYIFGGIILLIIVGFTIFTLYPYYYTQKKVTELKMQTIESVVTDTNFNSKGSLPRNELLIKIVQESPSQLSTNFQMLVWSTATAVLGLILPFLIK